jgi:hypothetical protein
VNQNVVTGRDCSWRPLPQRVVLTPAKIKQIAGGSPTLPLPPPDVARLALFTRFEPQPVPW